MGGILDKLDEWLRGLLIEGITGNLSGMFDTVNTKVGEIAGEVGQTPLAWNSGVFSMIRNLSETVIVPIAGVILTFVMCYELIQLVTEKNNMHDVDTWMFFKWIFKTFCAVLIVTNTWNIVMGIFDVGQSVVNQSAGVIIGETSIDINSVITDMEAQLEALGTGELFGLWFQSLFVGLTMNALSICIMLVVYGRMIEVYLFPSPRGDKLCLQNCPTGACGIGPGSDRITISHSTATGKWQLEIKIPLIFLREPLQTAMQVAAMETRFAQSADSH